MNHFLSLRRSGMLLALVVFAALFCRVTGAQNVTLCPSDETALLSVLTETMNSSSCHGDCASFSYQSLYSLSNALLGWNVFYNTSTSSAVILSDPCTWTGVSCAISGSCNVITGLNFTDVNLGCPGASPCTAGRAAFPKAFSGLTSLTSLRFVNTNLSPYFYSPPPNTFGSPRNLLLRPEYNSGVQLVTLFADSPLGPVSSSVTPLVLSDAFFLAQNSLTSFTCRTCYLRGGFPASVVSRTWSIFDVSVPVAQTDSTAGYVAMCGTLFDFAVKPAVFSASGHCFSSVPTLTNSSTLCSAGACAVASSTFCDQLKMYNETLFQYTALQQRNDCTVVCSTSCTAPMQPDPNTCACACPLSLQLGCAGKFEPSSCGCTCNTCANGGTASVSTCECTCTNQCDPGVTLNPDCSCGVPPPSIPIDNLNYHVSGQPNGTFFVFPEQSNGLTSTLGVSVPFVEVSEVTPTGSFVARFPVDQLKPFGFISYTGAASDESNTPVTVFIANSKMRSGVVLTLEALNQVAASSWLAPYGPSKLSVPAQVVKSSVNMQYTFGSPQNRAQLYYNIILAGSAPFPTTLTSSAVLTSTDVYSVNTTIRRSDTGEVVINVVTNFLLTAFADGSFVSAMQYRLVNDSTILLEFPAFSNSFLYDPQQKSTGTNALVTNDQSDSSSSGLSAGAIVGIVVGVACFACIVFIVFALVTVLICCCLFLLILAIAVGLVAILAVALVGAGGGSGGILTKLGGKKSTAPSVAQSKWEMDSADLNDANTEDDDNDDDREDDDYEDGDSDDDEDQVYDDDDDEDLEDDDDDEDDDDLEDEEDDEDDDLDEDDEVDEDEEEEEELVEEEEEEEEEEEDEEEEEEEEEEDDDYDEDEEEDDEDEDEE